MEIIQAGVEQLEALVPLLDGYRMFYKQPSNTGACREFLQQRFRMGDSVIFLAREGAEAMGFTQLYPSYSTVSLQPLLILNDLYVNQNHRNKGVGAALLTKAQGYCAAKGCKGLALETALDNPAQELYERLGWEKESHCFHYFWTCPRILPH
jgi:GNAT superfamily N-acetyltransferase